MTPGNSFAQLLTEFTVSDLDRSLQFYSSLGFRVERRTGPFAVVSWEGEHLLFLEEQPGLPAMPAMYANVRIMVPDVDARWEQARELGAAVEKEVADRHYGLRDFTILDPDGFGLRFATPIPH